MAPNNTFAFLSGILVPTALAAVASLLMGGAGCGSSTACFYWTEAEGACPSQGEALDFFQDPFCSSSITSVDSEGTFEGDTCCYDVSENDSSFGDSTCFPGNIGPGGPETSVGVTVGVGGAGGVAVGPGGVGGAGGAGAGGSGDCSKCKQFMLETDAPPLCGASIPLYDALTNCRCAVNSPCFQACESSACMNLPPSKECDTCMLDQTDGCGDELAACSQDQ
ncbi:hypothetical protein [Polyangium aurulentum]|uniref:hypothetical protein n=1 Tax=Polyangium aurulentum TaxID=2567896 RepID=UPI00197FF9FD|nr:hypothetical protein [Polyangium aurulentum]UQA55613.1 hypothetical protein E8A73_030260 [Polyangium aurulentum]